MILTDPEYRDDIGVMESGVVLASCSNLRSCSSLDNRVLAPSMQPVAPVTVARLKNHSHATTPICLTSWKSPSCSGGMLPSCQPCWPLLRLPSPLKMRDQWQQFPQFRFMLGIYPQSPTDKFFPTYPSRIHLRSIQQDYGFGCLDPLSHGSVSVSTVN